MSQMCNIVVAIFYEVGQMELQQAEGCLYGFSFLGLHLLLPTSKWLEMEDQARNDG